jgi:hypothetical protein
VPSLPGRSSRSSSASTIALSPSTSLSSDDHQQIALLLRRYRGIHVSLINEATLWSRLVYPLLLTAERDAIKAWSEVPISAQVGDTEIQGVVDGALAAGGADAPLTPLLPIVEAKRGTEAANPVYPLYAALLCVGWNEAHARGSGEHLCHGCFTIADHWTFVEARVRAGDAARPRVRLRSSREYSEKLEAHLILSIRGPMARGGRLRRGTPRRLAGGARPSERASPPTQWRGGPRSVGRPPTPRAGSAACFDSIDFRWTVWFLLSFVEFAVALAQRVVEGDETVYRSRQDKPYTIPGLSLVDGETTSAAELVAGVSQAHERALAAGEKTCRKTTRRTLCAEERGARRATVVQVRLPGGRDSQGERPMPSAGGGGA